MTLSFLLLLAIPVGHVQHTGPTVRIVSTHLYGVASISFGVNGVLAAASAGLVWASPKDGYVFRKSERRAGAFTVAYCGNSIWATVHRDSIKIGPLNDERPTVMQRFTKWGPSLLIGDPDFLLEGDSFDGYYLYEPPYSVNSLPRKLAIAARSDLTMSRRGQIAWVDRRTVIVGKRESLLIDLSLKGRTLTTTTGWPSSPRFDFRGTHLSWVQEDDRKAVLYDLLTDSKIEVGQPTGVPIFAAATQNGRLVVVLAQRLKADETKAANRVAIFSPSGKLLKRLSLPSLPESADFDDATNRLAVGMADGTVAIVELSD